jgi:tellurite resistance protein TehA-like permease
MTAKVKYWTTGLVLAIVGLMLARVVSSAFTGQAIVQLTFFLFGSAVAVVGLGVILAGLRK